MILEGNVIPVKQCMPEGMEIDVETVDFDNEEQSSPAFRAKRFLGILRVDQMISKPHSLPPSPRERFPETGYAATVVGTQLEGDLP